MQMYLTDIMTVAANIAGNPAISVPCGEAEGLPVGLQFIAPMRQDRSMLAAARAYQEIAK
jgi:aspartyl-tRNA(Asn)/glutamyl-tRNA(Gln) amidotransferase subunit A